MSIPIVAPGTVSGRVALPTPAKERSVLDSPVLVVVLFVLFPVVFPHFDFQAAARACVCVLHTTHSLTQYKNRCIFAPPKEEMEIRTYYISNIDVYLI